MAVEGLGVATEGNSEVPNLEVLPAGMKAFLVGVHLVGVVLAFPQEEEVPTRVSSAEVVAVRAS